MQIQYYLILSVLAFTIGLAGVLIRRSMVAVLFSLELMLNAVNINLLAFARLWGGTAGQIFVVFVVFVALIEMILGGIIIRTLIQNRHAMDIDEYKMLKG